MIYNPNLLNLKKNRIIIRKFYNYNLSQNSVNIESFFLMSFFLRRFFFYNIFNIFIKEYIFNLFFFKDNLKRFFYRRKFIVLFYISLCLLIFNWKLILRKKKDKKKKNLNYIVFDKNIMKYKNYYILSNFAFKTLKIFEIFN